MNISVNLYEEAAAFSAAAGEFLRSRPVHHNLILTLLDGRVTRPEPGRYWVAKRDGQVAGVVFQSPLTHSALVVPMETEVLTALVDALAESGAVLPGVSGDVATAASFAGQWTERRKAAASPFQGQRIYELAELNEISSAEGHLRKADESDRKLVEIWTHEYQIETEMRPSDCALQVDRWLAAKQLWLWQNEKAVSMAVAQTPIENVARLSTVYTPPEKRKCGYAASCIHALSKLLTKSGLQCMLYTNLANPISNSIYRQIGYRAVSEGIHYHFDQS
jgi:hypothetical protein